MSVNPLDIPEILQWILNCRQILDQEDLFSASLVNKAWYQVSKRAQWIKLELDSDSWVDPYHQALAAQLSMYGAFVRTLVLKECVADRSQLEAILPYMTCLQSIMVGRVTLYNRSSSLLQSLELLPMAHLQHLCLPHVSTASGRIDLLLRICESQTHQIMHLELLDSEIDDDVLADIARTCPSLKTLDLSRNEVIAFKGALDSSESDTMDDSQQNWTARAAAVSTQWASNRSNNNKNNSPYSQRQVVLQHDDTFDADDTLGVLLNEESKQQQTQTYHQQDQQNKQQYQTQQQDHTLTSTRPTQSPLPRLCPPSKLLREDPPFMHLEELSLVFCFGIANTEFQTLFRSFRNKSLRSLNLQFTNIEDSGLEALAQNMGHRLTSVSVSYCNRITARGIRALVEPNRCPRLLELEFLSCDFVSADCFRDPWGCHRLRRLEFTFHPRVAMKRMEIERAAAAAEAEAEEQFLQQQQHQDQQQQQMGQNASMDPLLDDGTNNFGLVLPHAQNQSQQGQAQLQHHLDHQQQQHHLEQQHLEQQQQHHQTPTLTNKQDNQALLLDSGVLLEESSRVREQYRDGLWLEEQESVRNDYYALFKQLKRLTALRYLSIYNSPALNNNNNSTHSGDSSSQDSADEPESTLPLDDPTPASPSQENWSESAEEEDGSSSSDSGRYGRRRESIASGSGQGEDEETDHIVPDDKSTKAAGVAEPSEMYQESTETATRLNSELESVHPFSLRMGLKALERLTNLESLTFYERSSVTIGEAEVRWIGKHFTHLLTLQLRGSIDVSEKASKQLASRRPDIKLQDHYYNYDCCGPSPNHKNRPSILSFPSPFLQPVKNQDSASQELYAIIMEVDPFEARLEFLSLLGKLNASQHSIQKVGNFAMKNRKLHEDLYNCIIEELEQTKSLNTRMNIFYVLDSICHQSHKAGFHGYIDLIQKNLPKIIECVTPSGPKGNVNVAGTKKILELWRARKLFSDSALDKVEKPLLSRELGANAPASNDTGFTKDDILKRMDEDRERHKRIREEIWIRPSDEDPGAEFLQYWDDVSDLDEVDYEDMEAENDKYLPGYPWELEFDRFLPSPAIFKMKPGLSAKLMESVLSDASSNNGSSNSSSGGNTPSAVKRLTSPEGTVSMAGGPAKPFTSAPTSIPVAPALPVAPSLPPPPPPLPPSLSSSGAETAAAGAGHSTKSNYYNHDYRDHNSHSHSLPHSQHQHHSHNYSSSNNNISSSNSSSHHHQHPHHHHQQQHFHSGSNSNSVSNSANHSRSHSSHSSSYYDHAIPTGPAADTAAAVGPSTSSYTSSRRGSPSTSSSSYHPYSRSSQYHERTNSNNSSTHSGYANGRGSGGGGAT